MFRLKGHEATLLWCLRQQRNYSFNNPLEKAVQLLQRTPFPSTSSGIKRQHRRTWRATKFFWISLEIFAIENLFRWQESLRAVFDKSFQRNFAQWRFVKDRRDFSLNRHKVDQRWMWATKRHDISPLIIAQPTNRENTYPRVFIVYRVSRIVYRLSPIAYRLSRASTRYRRTKLYDSMQRNRSTISGPLYCLLHFMIALITSQLRR